MIKATAHESVWIQASPETVWDYTQNWSHRSEWDAVVLEVLRQEDEPKKRIRARFQGGFTCDVEYKLNDRPRKTSLAMVNGDSKWIIGGGGSWRYDAVNGGTEWVQTNTLVLADGFLMKLFRPLVEMSLRRSTRKAMRKAKAILEAR